MKSLLHKFWIYLKLGWRWYASQYRGKWYQRVITPIASFFVFFYLANTTIGIIQEIRAKKCIDKRVLV